MRTENQNLNRKSQTQSAEITNGFGKEKRDLESQIVFEIIVIFAAR